ncbi:hypothetical protein BKA56DRAFT_638768 [Ilyonectria sp. MPI-CAGE-AT-0026]|nr:hypothetical protein BKA56DRAFT_638768 [Ilyonectria sp. MPI-CAGE-AT-0026]
MFELGLSLRRLPVPVRILNKYIYTVNFVKAYSISSITSIPNRGYVVLYILGAASIHLARCSQPDTLAAYFTYINQCDFRPAIIVIDLYQVDLLPAAPEMLVLLTHNDIAAEKGLSLVSGWALDPLPPPTTRPKSVSAIANAYTKSHQNLQSFSPHNSQIHRERFTNLALRYVADVISYVMEAWRPGRDDKKKLPEGGVEWLFLRIIAKVIRDGWFDLEVVIMD